MERGTHSNANLKRSEIIQFVLYRRRRIVAESTGEKIKEKKQMRVERERHWIAKHRWNGNPNFTLCRRRMTEEGLQKKRSMCEK